MMSAHSQGGRMAAEVPGLIVASLWPEGKKLPSASSSLKVWESIFPRIPSLQANPGISLAGIKPHAHSSANPSSQVKAVCWLAGMGGFFWLVYPSPGKVHKLFLKHQDWEERRGGQNWVLPGEKGNGYRESGPWHPLYCIVCRNLTDFEVTVRGNLVLTSASLNLKVFTVA